MNFKILLGSLALISASAGVAAQTGDYPTGFLCCNMRTDGAWISDINYQEAGKTGISVGTPTTVTGYGRNRVYVEINGRKQTIGNDYSRGMPLDAFARRYVVAEDPLLKIKTYPLRIQEAIASARLVKGMNREQVVMAVGYPVSDENTSLDNNEWHFWLSSFAEFVVLFDPAGLLIGVQTDFETRARVFVD